MARISVNGATTLIILMRRGVLTLTRTLMTIVVGEGCLGGSQLSTISSVYIEFGATKLYFYGAAVLLSVAV